MVRGPDGLFGGLRKRRRAEVQGGDEDQADDLHDDNEKETVDLMYEK